MWRTVGASGVLVGGGTPALYPMDLLPRPGRLQHFSVQDRRFEVHVRLWHFACGREHPLLKSGGTVEHSVLVSLMRLRGDGRSIHAARRGTCHEARESLRQGVRLHSG